MFFTGVYVLSRAGFAAGVAVMLVAISLMGVVYLGRRLGFVLIGLSAVAHVAVGVLVTRGAIHLDASEVDPMLLQNWFRMAAVVALLASLLALMIDSVIPLPLENLQLLARPRVWRNRPFLSRDSHCRRRIKRLNPLN